MADNDARYVKFILKHLSYFKLTLQHSKNTAIKQSQAYAPMLSRKFKNRVEFKLTDDPPSKQALRHPPTHSKIRLPTRSSQLFQMLMCIKKGILIY